MTDKVINFRIDEQTKTAFEMVAKNLDLTASQMLRSYMRETVENYMKSHAQQDLLTERPSVNKSPKAKAAKQKSVIPDAWRFK